MSSLSAAMFQPMDTDIAFQLKVKAATSGSSKFTMVGDDVESVTVESVVEDVADAGAQHKVDREDLEAAIKVEQKLEQRKVEQKLEQHKVDSADAEAAIKVEQKLEQHKVEQKLEQHKVDSADAEAAPFEAGVISAFLREGRVLRRGDILRRAFHGPSCLRCLECFGGR